MSRPVVLFLPGLLNDAALWAHQTAALADIADCRVADLTRSDTISGLADDALALAPGRFHLVGLSMGGYVAMEIMRRLPERVERLALLDTSARPDAPEQTERRNALIGLARSGRFRTVMPHMLPNLVHPDRTGDPALAAIAQGMADRVGPDAFARQQRAIMARPDSRPVLGGIACPTLVAGGRQDQLTPPEVMAEIARGIPGAVHVVVEDCGHLAPIERPQAVTALLRYWLLASERTFSG